MSHEELITLRMNLLGGMNEYILERAKRVDEDFLQEWFREGVPEFPLEEDLRWIAQGEEEWTTCCKLMGEFVEKELNRAES